MPSARLADSRITKIVAVVGGLADKDNPTEDELAAGQDITCALVEGYTLGMTASDTRNTQRSVCDQGNRQDFGAANYAGDLTFFREGDKEASENESAFLRAAAVFAQPGVQVDIVRRGAVPDAPESVKPESEPFVEGDVVEVFGFVTDYPITRTGQDANSDATFQTVLGQQSRFNTRAVVVTGGAAA